MMRELIARKSATPTTFASLRFELFMPMVVHRHALEEQASDNRSQDDASTERAANPAMSDKDRSTAAA